jgi:hypothetical protein
VQSSGKRTDVARFIAGAAARVGVPAARKPVDWQFEQGDSLSRTRFSKEAQTLYAIVKPPVKLFVPGPPFSLARAPSRRLYTNAQMFVPLRSATSRLGHPADALVGRTFSGIPESNHAVESAAAQVALSAGPARGPRPADAPTDVTARFRRRQGVSLVIEAPYPPERPQSSVVRSTLPSDVP